MDQVLDGSRDKCGLQMNGFAIVISSSITWIKLGNLHTDFEIEFVSFIWGIWHDYLNTDLQS